MNILCVNYLCISTTLQSKHDKLPPLAILPTQHIQTIFKQFVFNLCSKFYNYMTRKINISRGKAKGRCHSAYLSGKSSLKCKHRHNNWHMLLLTAQPVNWIITVQFLEGLLAFFSSPWIQESIQMSFLKVSRCSLPRCESCQQVNLMLFLQLFLRIRMYGTLPSHAL